jgi:hypothetical protein
MCSAVDCYRQICPYWRYAIELFPLFKKERIPIARFLCRSRQVTFSLLPIQLIPYFQYTVYAVIGTLLFGFACWQMGQRGFFGAMLAVEPESLVTPWLVFCWLGVVVRGLQRAHRVLRRFYNLSGIGTLHGTVAWEGVAGYFQAFGWKPQIRWGPLLHELVHQYSRTTKQFLFGTPSQQRVTIRK